MKYRSVFISDIHLGTDICQYDKLLEFLKSLESAAGESYEIENLFLVGDIIDFIAMKSKNRWTQGHTTVIQKFLRMSRKGVKIYMIYGNHDIAMEMVEGWTFGNIEVKERHVHQTLKGMNILVLHGHQFDSFAKTMPWLYWLGDKSYSFALFINKWFNRVRKLFGFKYWSLSYYLKSKVKKTVKFMSDFNALVSKECEKEKCNICLYGHTHIPCDIEMESGIRVLNGGCSTEITTCTVETSDGDLKVIDYQTGDIVT